VNYSILNEGIKMKKRNFFEPKNSTKLTELPEDVSQNKYPDYPDYPESEDIYSRDKETDIDPEKLAERPLKAESGADDEILKKNPNIITDLIDTPGSELDDTLEAAGDEDEENNYYSLGSDNNEITNEE